ncbi:hypothetical protein H4S14_001323 [Agrobacterium vitis]|nr:hypothetical protein [Agrobacterium vitis]MBE1437585.1 hypothetical protein [Agrobacterium vitis]
MVNISFLFTINPSEMLKEYRCFVGDKIGKSHRLQVLAVLVECGAQIADKIADAWTFQCIEA